MFRLFLLIHFYDKSNSCFFATRETNISERLHCPLLFYRKKKRIILVFQNKSLLLQHPRGEILGSRMRFLLYPVNRNRQNFKRRDEDNATLILFVYPVYSPRCTSMVYTTAWGICFSVHFLMVFADTRFTMSVTSLYAFLVCIIKHKLNNADFGRLVGNVKMYWL